MSAMATRGHRYWRVAIMREVRHERGGALGFWVWDTKTPVVVKKVYLVEPPYTKKAAEAAAFRQAGIDVTMEGRSDRVRYAVEVTKLDESTARKNPRKKNTILVEVKQDRIGSLIVRPVAKTLRAALRKHATHWDKRAYDDLYIQRDDEVETFLKELPAATRRSIKGGWTAKILVDGWTFLSMFGYDAAEAVRQDSAGRWHWHEHWSDYPKSAR